MMKSHVLPHHQDQTPYPVVFHDALRAEERWHNGQSQEVIVSGGKTKIQGMRMEQQKNKKRHHKNENFEIN